VSRAISILVVALMVHGLSSSGASVYLVRPDGMGDFPTIQAAIDAAVDGDVIELADGTFFRDGNHDLDYRGKAITVRSESGNAAACVMDCQRDAGRTHRGFVFHSGEGPGSILEGITIRHGDCSDAFCMGGGIHCTMSSPHIQGCVIDRCAAYGVGGGVSCSGGSLAQFESCTFSDNGALYFGGGGYSHGSSPTFTHCTFIDNASGDGGGALACDGGGDLVLLSCLFSGNGTQAATGGGGALLCDGSTRCSVTDCRFVGNSSGGNYWGCGGAVSLQNASAVAFTRCTFAENTGGYCGGAIYAVDSAPVLELCTLTGNSAFMTGGAMCLSASDLTVRGCTLIGNSAMEGSGIAWSGHLDLSWTIVAFGVWGEGILCGTGTALLSCCDLYGNQGGDWVGPIAEQSAIHNNISADPLFCDRENEDFSLRADSPCAPENNHYCNQLGAWPVGCAETPIETTTWGAVKAMFRR